MNYQILFFILLIWNTFNAQNSNIWENYVTAKQQNLEPILPDFSYAGYKYSETAIPTVNYKVFNVLDFGAIPNDNLSDKPALLKTIAAAQTNGEGIIFFPKGTYYINTTKEELNSIIINTSKIVFRGEKLKENQSTLFFKKDIPPTDSNKLWSCPYAIKTTVKEKDVFLTKVISFAKRETFNIQVENTHQLKKGDWIILKMVNNNPELIKEDLGGIKIDSKWTSIINKGVQVNERHQIKKIVNNTITFYDPIHYTINPKHNWKLYRFAHLHSIGFENLNFKGNWTKKFVHHGSAQDDGGWSILQISKVVNSWVKNCHFINVNNAISFSQSAASTALNITIRGNKGHSAVHAAGGSTGILLAKINDLAGMHHTTGVAGGSTTATVIWKCKHTSDTSFEIHASQPRCTLFDTVEGGFFAGRAGGAVQNLPNHGKYLVLWNYKETDTKETNFKFIATGSKYWKIVPPIIVGFHGSGTTFLKEQIQYIEGKGLPVHPSSLFKAQLELRLGYLPKWIYQTNLY